jgi:alkyl hydroperoxide reductase subunit AhpF
MLNAQAAAEIRQRFEALRDPVRLVVFSQSLTAPELCAENEALMREVAALSDRISVEVLNPAIDRERAAAYGITAVPATVVEGARDYGIRFLGVPGGYEFSAFLDAILVASTGEPQLSPETRQALAGLARDAEIKVFSTPT